MKRRTGFLVVLLAAAQPSCTRHPSVPRAREPLGEGAAVLDEAFRRHEVEVLRTVALADPRLAERFALQPTHAELDAYATQVLTAEDADALGTGRALGTPAALAFSSRRRALANATAAHEAWIRGHRPGPGTHAALESELLARLLEEENQRLLRETRLGPWTPALLESLVEGWTPPSDARESSVRSEAFARLFERLRRELQDVPLTMTERDSLDDVLDPFEHRIDGQARAGAALAALRVSLGERETRKPYAFAADAWAHALAPTLGSWAEDPSQLASRMNELRDQLAPLRTAATNALASLSPEDKTRAFDDAARYLAAPQPCPVPKIPESPLRNAEPPPERRGQRSFLCIMSKAKAPWEHAAASLAAHDTVAMALWVDEVHRLGQAPYPAQDRFPLMVQTPAENAPRQLRRVLRQPASCVGAAQAAAWVMGVGLEAAPGRAFGVLAQGDMPLPMAIHQLETTQNLQKKTALSQERR